MNVGTNPSKKGLATVGKIGIVVVLIVVSLGVVYILPSLSKGNGSQSTHSQTTNPSSSTSGGNRTLGLLSLFGYFSQMQMQVSVSDGSEDPNEPVVSHQDVSYVVLGKATLNSTEYTKVEFSQVGAGDNVIAWFSPQGGIYRVDVLGDKNYTGSNVAVYADSYVSAFSLVTTTTNNATLLSILSKTSETTTSIGPTQMEVASYVLAAPFPPFTSITVRYATIPGTDQRLVVYLDEMTSSHVEETFQITSLAK